jgi:poly(ADP-ribose) glycohydrolase ARH3
MTNPDSHHPGRSIAQQLDTATASILKDKFRGALLGLTVGDSLGAPFEGHRNVSRSEWESVADAMNELRFTDDSHMTFGVAESLLVHPEFDAAHMVGVFARDYFNEPWRGYGAGPPQVFDAVRRGVPAEVAARRLYGGSGSLGNGAAMRVAPIALVFAGDLVRIEDVARRSAAITHVHPLGIEGAVVQALAVNLALQLPSGQLDPGSFLDSFRRFGLSQTFLGALEKVGDLLPSAPSSEVVEIVGNGIEAHRSVPAALFAFLSSRGDFARSIECAVRLGGDTDTIAAMAGALAGAAWDVKASLRDGSREQREEG